MITLLVGVPPFAVYGSARLTGELPSYQEWLSSGPKHGPWAPPRIFASWGISWKGDLVVYSVLIMAVLLIVTFLISIILGLTASTKRFLTFVKGIGLVLLQLLWVYMIMLTMFWAID